MFHFIKNKINRYRREKLQYRQRIILLAQIGEDLFEDKKIFWSKNISCDINTVRDNHLQLIFTVDDELFEYDIKTTDESVVYLINFVETLYYHKNMNEIYYVSSTDNTSQFMMLNKQNNNKQYITLAMRDINNNLRVKIVPVTADFIEKFIVLTSNYIPTNISS